MPDLKNYRLLISYSWKHDAEYTTIVNWLNNESYFQWSNHSVTKDEPIDWCSKKELKEQLTRQIQGCNAIIIVSGMYINYSEWIDYEIKEALRMNKTIIGIKPRGNEKIPSIISENCDELVNWNSNSLIAAIRSNAK